MKIWFYMRDFSERLQYALYYRKLSQTEAARRCGISQQSINYILKNNIERSKLGHQIASGLNVSPDWLINGVGSIDATGIHKIPVADNLYYLQAILRNLPIEGLEYLYTEHIYGESVFAYRVDDRRFAICVENEDPLTTYIKDEFLRVDTNQCDVLDIRVTCEHVYRICEWRISNVRQN